MASAMARVWHTLTMACSSDDKKQVLRTRVLVSYNSPCQIPSRYLPASFTPTRYAITDTAQSQPRTLNEHHQPRVDIRTDSGGLHT